MKITILDVKTLKVIYSFKRKQEKTTPDLSADENFILAWRCAIADGLVEEEERDRYLLCSKPLESGVSIDVERDNLD